MDLKQRLVFCKQCQHKKLDAKIGIVCDIINKKPDFEYECPDYLNDPKETRRMVKKAEKLTEATGKTSSGSSSGTIWGTIGIVLIIIRIIIKLLR